MYVQECCVALDSAQVIVCLSLVHSCLLGNFVAISSLQDLDWVLFCHM